MAKNDLVLLDSIIDEYIQNKRPSENCGEVFEFFATEQILKNYAFSEQQILSGSVDGRNDGGIDEFFVLVNGHLAEGIPEEFWPKSNSELEVYIITCKHDDSFKQSPITTMIPSLLQLFDFSIATSELEGKYNADVLKKRNLLIATYKRLATTLTKFNINLIYACRGDESIESNIQEKADQAEQICQESFSECTAKFEFWGNHRFLTRYRENSRTTLDLRYESCINQNGQYMVLAKLIDYYDFIIDSDENLNRRIFDSNVRDYLGLNPVNADIMKSLADSDNPEFWWFNNGITIIGTQAHIVGNAISIENAQIVNGLQTSESIFNHFSDVGQKDDKRSVLIKIIITNDLNVRNAIIYATNNQTNVNVTALRATDKTQKDIEAILKTHGVYYDRRSNYYKNRGIPQESIIDPLALAAGYICLIYKNPFKATNLKQRFMRDDAKYQKIFSPETDLNVWYPIAWLLKKTDQTLSELKLNIRTVRFQKNYKQIILFTTMSRLMGTFAFGEKQLVEFDLSRYTSAEIKSTINDLKEVDRACFERTRKLPEHFYMNVYQYVAQKYNIKAVQSIAAKNRQLLDGEMTLASYGLSNELVEKISKELPKQPWPVKVHKQVAEALGIKEMIVRNAISYLIYTGRAYGQAYGYVFDTDGNVVTEGEHFGYTIEDARKKIDEQKIYNEVRFGVNSF